VDEFSSSLGKQHLVCQVYDPLLKRADPALFNHLKSLAVQPQLFGLRWVRVLFSREFSSADCLLLWDGIFASGPDLHLVPYVAVAMLMFVRQQLLGADYIGCLSRLQNFPQMDDVRLLIDVARRLKGEKQQPLLKGAALRSARERRTRDAEEGAHHILSLCR